MKNQKIKFKKASNNDYIVVGDNITINGRKISDYSLKELFKVLSKDKIDNEFLVITAASIVHNRLYDDEFALRELFTPKEEKKFIGDNIVSVTEKVYKRLKKLSRD